MRRYSLRPAGWDALHFQMFFDDYPQLSKIDADSLLVSEADGSLLAYELFICDQAFADACRFGLRICQSGHRNPAWRCVFERTRYLDYSRRFGGDFVGVYFINSGFARKKIVNSQ